MSDVVNEKEWRKRHNIRRKRDKKGFVWRRCAPAADDIPHQRWRCAPAADIPHHRPPRPMIVKIETETGQPLQPPQPPSYDNDEDDTLEVDQDLSSSMSSLDSAEDTFVTHSTADVETLNNQGGPDFLNSETADIPRQAVTAVIQAVTVTDSDIPRLPQSDLGLENIAAFKTNVRRNGSVRRPRETLIE